MAAEPAAPVGDCRSKESVTFAWRYLGRVRIRTSYPTLSATDQLHPMR